MNSKSIKKTKRVPKSNYKLQEASDILLLYKNGDSRIKADNIAFAARQYQHAYVDTTDENYILGQLARAKYEMVRELKRKHMRARIEVRHLSADLEKTKENLEHSNEIIKALEYELKILRMRDKSNNIA